MREKQVHTAKPERHKAWRGTVKHSSGQGPAEECVPGEHLVYRSGCVYAWAAEPSAGQAVWCVHALPDSGEQWEKGALRGAARESLQMVFRKTAF